MSNDITLDITYVNECFKKSLKEEDDVIIEAYIDGYNELVKFLNLIGTVFSFVSSDVKSKIKVIEKLKAEDSIYYESYKKMMKYEKETNLHEKKGFISGSRTMLRLHRGLDFIRLFLKRLSESNASDENTCTMCQTSYNETLALFHPWYIRKAATIAMYALPSKDDLLKKVFGSEDKLVEALAVLPQTLQSCDEVYSRVQQLYTEFDLHGLP